jgi:hypothetical protein
MTKPYDETNDSLYVSLKGGQYWRATKDIQIYSDFTIKAGTVLLLESVRDIEGQAHTVIVRPHPDVYAKMNREHRGSEPGDYRFLVQDFLSKFVLEPDYKRIRNEELARVQGRVAELQKELSEANANPSIMRQHAEGDVKKWVKEQKLLPQVAATLPDIPEQPEMIDQTLTIEKVEHMKLSMAKTKVIAESTALWIKDKVDEISHTVNALSPYYHEQVAAMMATTEDVRGQVDKMKTGIQSLDLYVGTSVEVKELKKGKDADPELPLTVMQRKLFMDEELSVWADIGEEFDFSKKQLFYDALVEHDSLVKQIFPTERCIVCIATTRRVIEYSDNPWVQSAIQKLNEDVFLLVRNGENIHIVQSPIESHSKSRRLFPSEKEMDEFFEETHSEFDWETHKSTYTKRTITFQDVQYTDRMTRYENAAVHYKRFIIMLAGLDHRLNLFGTFYNEPKGMNFMTPAFQNKHMRFIHDDDGEGLLPEVERIDFDVWVKTRNAYLRSGSRIIGRWREVMTPESAPGVVSYGERYDRFTADPIKSFGVTTAFREGNDIMIKVPVKKSTYRSDREYNAKVNLSAFLKNHGRAVGFLVLDAVKADDLEAYIYDRNSREHFVEYLRLFKSAINELRKDEQHEAPIRKAMLKALTDGNIATGRKAADIIDQAVIAWRASNRGAELPGVRSKAFTVLLDQMYTISRADEDWKKAQAFVEKEGRKPLRLVVSGKNQLSIYCTPLDSEIDNVLFPMAWVMNITLDRGPDGEFMEEGRRWMRLPLFTAAETTLHEWQGAEYWRDRVAPFENFDVKQKARDLCRDFPHHLTLFKPMSPEIWDVMFAQWKSMRDYMNEVKSKRDRHVADPHCQVVVGLEYDRSDKRLLFIAVEEAPHVLLYRHAPDKERKERVAEEYARRFNLYTDHKQSLRDAAKKEKISMCRVLINNAPEANGLTTHFMYSGWGGEPVVIDKIEPVIRKAIKERQERESYNSDFNKVYWFPTLGIDTTDDKPAKKGASR